MVEEKASRRRRRWLSTRVTPNDNCTTKSRNDKKTKNTFFERMANTDTVASLSLKTKKKGLKRSSLIKSTFTNGTRPTTSRSLSTHNINKSMTFLPASHKPQFLRARSAPVVTKSNTIIHNKMENRSKISTTFNISKPSNKHEDRTNQFISATSNVESFESLEEEKEEDLESRRQVAVLAVEKDGWELRNLDEEWQCDGNTVMVAVNNDGWALQWASFDLQSDRDIVMAAVTNAGGALQYASDELKSDKDVVIAALKSDWRALYYAADELKADKGVVKVAFTNNRSSLFYVADEVKKYFIATTIVTGEEETNSSIISFNKQ